MGAVLMDALSILVENFHAASAKPEARKFLEFLLSSDAVPAFEAQGFSIQGKVG